MKQTLLMALLHYMKEQKMTCRGEWKSGGNRAVRRRCGADMRRVDPDWSQRGSERENREQMKC